MEKKIEINIDLNDEAAVTARITQLENQIKQLQEVSDISEYYQRKYLEMAEEIKDIRFQEIVEELNQIEKEITALRTSQNEIGRKLEENDSIKAEINELKQKLETKYIELETRQFEYQNQVAKITDDTVSNYQHYQNEVNNYFSAFGKYIQTYDDSLIIPAIDRLSNYFASSGFHLQRNIKEAEGKIQSKTKQYEIDIKNIKAEIETLKEQKLVQEVKVNSALSDQLQRVKSDYAARFEHKNLYQKELASLFALTTSKQLKELTDYSVRIKLLKLSPNEQVSKYDQLFDDFKKELLSLETPSTVKYQTRKRLSLLLQEKERLAIFQAERENLESEIRDIEENLTKLVTRKACLQDYVNGVQISLSSDPSYQKYYKDYTSNKTIIATAKQAIQREENEKQYQEECRYLAMYNAKTSDVIAKIDELIEQSTQKITRHKQELLQAELDLKNLSISPAIAKLLDDIKLYQPVIAKSQLKENEWANLLTTKQERLKELRHITKGYQTILGQIDELESLLKK